METVGLLLLGVVLGALLGGAGAWLALQQRVERLRADDAEAARATLDAALRDAAERSAAALQDASDRAAVAEERTREVLAARQDAIVAQVHQQAARDRADVEQRLSAALAQVAGLQEAVETARRQHRELVETQRRERAERERGEAG
jgi:gas vesicle protein